MFSQKVKNFQPSVKPECLLGQGTEAHVWG